MGITTPGVGSGLDINGLVSKLMSAEQAPLNQLNSSKRAENTKLSAYGTLKGALSSLQSAAQALSYKSGFSGASATSSDTSLVSVAASSGASVASYSVTVQSLATAQRSSTGSSFANASDPVGKGTLIISTGSGDSKKDVSIDLSSKTRSLSDIKDAINSSGAGVTATIVSGKTEAQLILTAKDTGLSNGFSLSNPDGGLSRLTQSIGVTSPGSDASLSINGTAVSSSTNTITSAIDGLTITALKASPSTPVAVTVAQDPSATKSSIQSFVKAFNDLNSQISSLSKYDPNSKVGGPLNGEMVTRNIQSTLSAIISTPVTNNSGGPAFLSDVGITRQKDGSLSVDVAKLDAATSNLAKPISGLFVANTSGDGIAAQINTAISKITGADGLLTARTDGISIGIKDIDKRINETNARLTSIEARYRQQFNALDAMLSSMNQTTSYLTAQFDAMSAAAKK